MTGRVGPDIIAPLGREPLETFHVRAADAAGPGSNQDLIGIQLGNLHLLDAKISRSV
jgi:hypothetical protein